MLPRTGPVTVGVAEKTDKTGMTFTTKEFPGRTFDDFDEYDKAKKERLRIRRELNNPSELSVEINVGEDQQKEREILPKSDT